MNFSSRVQPLHAEGAYVVLAKAQQLEAQGRDILHFEIGQPDFAPPSHAILAGIQAIADGQTRYTPPGGIPELRSAIAADAGQRRGLTFSPQQVVVSPGLKPNLFFAMLALLEPGDEVIYPDPGYPSYAALPGLAGGIGVPVPVLEERDFSFDLDAFDRLLTPRTRVILLNSPANPTGGVMSRSDLEHIARQAIVHDSYILSDEIYCRLAYDGLEVPSIASLPGMAERTVICDGFSKTYAMTGWRLGYAILPSALAERVEVQLMHVIGCAAQATQLAALAALTGPQAEVDAHVADYQHRRDLLVAGLNQIPGLTCRKPQGAFYVFPNIRAFGLTSDQMADYLLDEAGVAVLAGNGFGANGEGYIRLSYCTSEQKIHQGVERIAQALSRLSIRG
jgi:aspartate/methionine/tyrosine aminotransferase